MKLLINEKLSQHRFKDNNGYLVCTNCILSRIGKQTYQSDEVFHDGCYDEVDIDRPEKEVFSDQALASFENVPVTIEHPDENVGPENHNHLAVGFVRDIRRGEDNGGPVMIGDLVITDADAIELVESGKMTDLSCGYDCDISKDDLTQRNIRGNHVALCEQGRAGNARIIDSIKDESIRYKGHKIELVYLSYYDDGHYAVDGHTDKRDLFETIEEAKNYINSLRYDSVNDKLVEPSKEDITFFEKQLEQIGFKISGKGKTLMGSNHYQVLTKSGLNEKSDLEYLARRLDNLDEQMYQRGIPMTYNVGLQNDGYISAGIDLREKYVKDSINDNHKWVLKIYGVSGQYRGSKDFNNFDDLYNFFDTKIHSYEDVEVYKDGKFLGNNPTDIYNKGYAKDSEKENIMKDKLHSKLVTSFRGIDIEEWKDDIDNSSVFKVYEKNKEHEFNTLEEAKKYIDKNINDVCKDASDIRIPKSIAYKGYTYNFKETKGNKVIFEREDNKQFIASFDIEHFSAEARNKAEEFNNVMNDTNKGHRFEVVYIDRKSDKTTRTWIEADNEQEAKARVKSMFNPYKIIEANMEDDAIKDFALKIYGEEFIVRLERGMFVAYKNGKEVAEADSQRELEKKLRDLDFEDSCKDNKYCHDDDNNLSKAMNAIKVIKVLGRK